MASKVGEYWQLTHDRPRDYDMIREGEVDTILVYQPEFSKILKAWNAMKNQPNRKLVLRMWDWDDNRTDPNPEGVYRKLRDDPAGAANLIVNNWLEFWRDFERRCEREGISDRPGLDDVLFHLWNEPDTNTLVRQIDEATSRAIDKASQYGMWLLCFNFGTGHPAELDSNGQPNWSPFTRSINKIRGTRHCIGVHEYYNDLGLKDPSVYPWHVGRHAMPGPRVALAGCKLMVSEFGLEMLVNNRRSGHHGYVGIIPGNQFGADIVTYGQEICIADRILIFATDLEDSVWKTFDPIYAYDSVVAAMRTLKAGKPPVEPPVEPEGILIWPCDGTLTQRFGENEAIYREKFGIPGHNGIDIAAAEGTIIKCVADGIVAWSDWDDSYGWYVRVYHPKLFMHSLYAHLAERSDLPGGAFLEQGVAVGKMGSTGNSTGPHLHFETRMGKEYEYRDVHIGYRRGRCNPEAIYAAHGLYW